jgi:uncharacterized membrane protein YjjP (DUF1212 family)
MEQNPALTLQQLQAEKTERIVGVIIRIGVIFLEAGAEVYRVEETMNRLGMAIDGVEDCVCYVTVTGITCSVVMNHATVTRVSRVSGGTRNLAVINAINQLSRLSEKNHYTVDQLEVAINRIEQLPVYSDSFKMLFGAIGAAGFALFFKGTMIDIVSSFFIGLLVRLMTTRLDKTTMNTFFVNALASFLVAWIAETIHSMIPAASVDTIIISSIMLLVPGLTLTNSLRDVVMGEYLSGVARLTEAMVVATAIALGVGIGLYLY